MASLYLEQLLEGIDSLPAELQRNFNLVRELDIQSERKPPSSLSLFPLAYIQHSHSPLTLALSLSVSVLSSLSLSLSLSVCLSVSLSLSLSLSFLIKHHVSKSLTLHCK